MTHKWFKAAAMSAAFAAASYMAVTLWVGRKAVLVASAHLKPNVLVTVLGLSLINYGLRFVRWHMFLRVLGCQIDLLSNLRIYVSGFALTTTPGKAGELARTIWLHPYGISTNKSVAAFCAERIMDFFVILLLSSLAYLDHPRVRWMLLVGLLLTCAIVALLFMPKLANSPRGTAFGFEGRIQHFLRRSTEILKLTCTCFTPLTAMAGISIGIIAWTAECWGFSILIGALGYPVPIQEASSIYALSILAGAISFMPGGLGGSEAAMIILLRIAGLPSAVAVSATLLIRLATLWFAVALGLIAITIRGKTNNGGLWFVQASIEPRRAE